MSEAPRFEVYRWGNTAGVDEIAHQPEPCDESEVRDCRGCEGLAALEREPGLHRVVDALHRSLHCPHRLSPRQVANRLRARHPRWIPIRQRLPKPTVVNGFHASLGVLALINGRSVRPCFFCLHGGDALYPDVPPVGEFHTDEGLFYRGVTHWMPLPRGRRS